LRDTRKAQKILVSIPQDRAVEKFGAEEEIGKLMYE
jgi:hypothetical protein